MSVSSTSARPTRSDDPSVMTRLGVAWQHPETRSIRQVGLLWQDRAQYHFRYVRNVKDIDGFTPFLRFPGLRGTYSSERLFPLFAQRVMDPRRPDYEEYVRTLDLVRDSTPWEQLARSEGRRAGDAIMVFPEPSVEPDGATWVQVSGAWGPPRYRAGPPSCRTP
jgi:hypothetical protein